MGKGFIFFFWVWLIVVIAGNVVAGSNAGVATKLTVALDDNDTTIRVRSTTGFPDAGLIQIDSERIAYSLKTTTTFSQSLAVGNVVNPLVRGAMNTANVSHSVNAVVRTIEGGMMNSAIAYNIAVISNPDGLWAAIATPLALLRLIASFFVLPVAFLGTDLQIIGVIWWVCVAGMIVSVGISLAGSRRV